MKINKTFVLAACSAMLLAACSEDQTAFELSNVEGRAKVSGTIVYNQGTTVEGGKFCYNYKPAANVAVYAQIPNSYYQSGAHGTTVLTTTTDGQGHYSFDIPVSNSSASVTIKMQPFEGTTSAVDLVDQKPQVVTNQAIFVASVTTSVADHDIKVVNLTATGNDVDKVPSSYTYTVPFQAVIGQNMEYKVAIAPRYNANNAVVGYDDASIRKVWQPAARVDFIMRVYDGTANITLNGTTDAQGKCTLQIPVAEIPATFNYSVEPVSYLGKYTHYIRADEPVVKILPSGTPVSCVDYDAVTLDGYYKAAFTPSADLTYDFANFTESSDMRCMVFNPAPGTDAEGYSYTGWSSKWLADLLEELKDK